MEPKDLFKIFTGYDLASIYLEDNIEIHGYLLESPLEERMVRMFKYEPVGDNAFKPYQAHWMITENNLCLLYVNARLNGEFLFTDNIVPEYDGEDDEGYAKLHYFTQMNGELDFVIQEIVKNTNVYLPFKTGETISVTFQNGMLTELK